MASVLSAANTTIVVVFYIHSQVLVVVDQLTRLCNGRNMGQLGWFKIFSIVSQVEGTQHSAYLLHSVVTNNWHEH